MLIISSELDLSARAFLWIHRWSGVFTAETTTQAMGILHNNEIEVIAYRPLRCSSEHVKLVERLKHERLKTPIIALTTNASEAKEIGAKGYIDPELFFPRRA